MCCRIIRTLPLLLCAVGLPVTAGCWRSGPDPSDAERDGRDESDEVPGDEGEVADTEVDVAEDAPEDLPDHATEDAADADTVPDADPECGNGVVEPGEECEEEPARACITGCGTAGEQSCEACRWSACRPPAETCNGLDDDCDTSCDDGFACCAGGAGPCPTTCGSVGTGACSASCEWSSCEPPAEACNGLDDDCDGETDEGCACATGWERVDMRYDGVPGTSWDVWGTAWNDIYVAGSGAPLVLMHYDGSSWVEVALPPEARFFLGEISGWASDGLVIYAGDGFLRFDGTTWSVMDAPWYVTGISATAADDIYAVTLDDEVWHYDGAAWASVGPPGVSTPTGFLDVFVRTPTEVYVVGGRYSSAYVFRYDGTSWTELSRDRTTNDLRGVWAAGPDDVFVAGGWTSSKHFDGTVWTDMRGAGTSVSGLAEFWGQSRDLLFAVGYGLFWYDGNPRYEWLPLTTPEADGLRPSEIWGSSPENIYLLTSQGALFHRCGPEWWLE